MSHANSPVMKTGKSPMRSAVSLFAGCGGFCEGMELAGFQIKCAVEIDRFSAETYRHNFPSVPLVEDDVARFLGDTQDDIRRFGLHDIDVVFGGPPCQGYSQIGTRDLKDVRNSLYKRFARVVEQIQPRVFLMENVPNLLLMNRGHFRDLILRKFAEIGYANTIHLVLSAADYGVPQLRQRVIFIGIRDRDTTPASLQEICTAALAEIRVNRPFTVHDAISDLPKHVVPSGEVMRYPPKNNLSSFQRMMRLDCDGGPYTRRDKLSRGMADSPLVLHNHHTKEILSRRLHLISLLRPGQKADSLPKKIWDGRRPEKWRRLHPDEPSYTILAQMHRDLSEWVHPSLQRWITVREAARLQAFHDGFVFKSSEWQQLKQIGNAVPPLLAHAVGHMAMAVLERIKRRRVTGRLRYAAAE